MQEVTTAAGGKSRSDVVNTTIKWMEGIENEERRKLVNALKRTKTVLENPNNPKLVLARKELGKPTSQLQAIIIIGKRHGKPRFSLEFLTPEEIRNLKNSEFLLPNEAIEISQNVKIERSNYAHRIKLAFIFLAGKFGIKSFRDFHYSVDGEHFTKAYKNKEEVPPEEQTINHQSALQVLKEDSNINPNIYAEPAFGVAQTKVFRVSSRNSNEVYNELLKYSHKSNDKYQEEPKSSWIVISKNLEDKNQKEKKAYYTCKRIYTTETYVRANKNFKIAWPANQTKSLTYLLELCKDLILQQLSKSLGESENYYATIFERKTNGGPEGLLYKALISTGTDKTQASKLACAVIDEVWTDYPDNSDKPSIQHPPIQKNQTNQTGQTSPKQPTKAIACLSLSDCSLLKHLVEQEDNNKYSN